MKKKLYTEICKFFRDNLVFSPFRFTATLKRSKMTILTTFTHPPFVKNLLEFDSSVEHKEKCNEEC